MILATHAIVGAAIGKNVQNPWLIIILSLIVHFIMDGFRHGEYFDSRIATIKDTAWKILLDLSTAGMIILFFILIAHPNFFTIRNILLGSFFSMFPDFLTLLFFKFKWNALCKIKDFHSFCHHYSRFPKFSPERRWNFRNAANDVLISLIAIVFLFL